MIFTQGRLTVGWARACTRLSGRFNNHINLIWPAGAIDDETARELGLQKGWFTASKLTSIGRIWISWRGSRLSIGKACVRLLRRTMGKMNLHDKAVLAVTTGAMNIDLVCWHETVFTIGPKLRRKKCEQSLHISWLTNGEIVFAPRTFPPAMIVNVLAPDWFYFFVGSLAQKTNMFVKQYRRYFTFQRFLP